SVMQYYKTFTDIAGHWSRSYVEKMASRYIAKGENGSFRPDATISRAEFTALLVRSLELGAPAASTNSSFTDVAADKWYASEIGKAYTAGIASKADGVSFRPDVEITREEIVVMVARALKYGGKGLELSEEQVAQRLGGFSDYEQVAESARGPFAIALEKGIVKGRTADTIAPKGNATRAEAIVMIYRLLNVK
ncbi:MAG: S-layer homology domain-containing protein, partial [Pseudomonadota bacterium]